MVDDAVSKSLRMNMRDDGQLSIDEVGTKLDGAAMES
jgi:hypothetical protein